MLSEHPQLILASSSPRRRELIGLLGLTWRVQAAAVDETIVDHPDPAVNVMQTAELKADAVAALGAEAVILAADTIVVLDDQVLNKPVDEEDAFEMLARLRGRVHQVYTGIVVQNTVEQVMDYCSVDVPMREYSDAEIAQYIKTGDPLDKAGAYAIQHPEFRPAPGISGCFAAVVGLPLCHVSRALNKIGLPVPGDLPGRCQEFHSYSCPIFTSILD